MSAWDVNLYMQFENERTQPAIDLVSRININQPRRIIDLGCGAGNSTEILRRRWPDAQIGGLDSSPEMITAARTNNPDMEWMLGDAGAWHPSTVFDLVFSNAAILWIPKHDELLPHLLNQVAPGGVLAIQIPAQIYSVLHRLILKVADEPEWAPLMAGAKSTFTIENPSYYYDVLIGESNHLDIWETEYCHIMEDHQAIIKWISSTGLRPFIEALATEKQKQLFIQMLSELVVKAYPPQIDGKVLFPFRRIFLVAYR